MTRRTITEALLFVGLVAAGALTRVYYQELPNFAPVAAIALFAGVVFRSWVVAVTVPLTAMVLSDLSIGFYDGRMLTLVYGSLAVPVLARGVLRRQFAAGAGARHPALRGLVVLGCSLVSSVIFFLVTNFGCWLWFRMYPDNLGGLLASYAAAVPFFRATLAGDLFFTGVLFGGYALARRYGMTPASSVPPVICQEG